MSFKFRNVLDFLLDEEKICPEFHMKCTDYVVVFEKTSHDEMPQMLSMASHLLSQVKNATNLSRSSSRLFLARVSMWRPFERILTTEYQQCLKSYVEGIDVHKP